MDELIYSRDSNSVAMPTLYKLKNEDKIQIWDIYVRLYDTEGNEMDIDNTKAPFPEGSYCIIKSKYGYKGGKIQETKVKVSKGKNLGKKSETNILSQSISEMVSKWKNKCRKDMYYKKEDLPETESEEGATKGSKGQKRTKVFDRSLIRPMLLHEFQNKKSGVIYPAYTQPKLDGVRMLCNFCEDTQKFRFFSRTGKEFYNLDHLSEALCNSGEILKRKSVFLDGEAYSDQITFNEIVGRVRKKLFPEVDEKVLGKQEVINFCVFDTFDLESPEEPFKERYSRLCDLQLRKPIIRVKCKVIKSEKDLYDRHKYYLETGNEGTVIRNFKGIYTLGKRSADSLKLKDFKTEEFKIVGFTEGKGRDDGAIIYKLVTKEGKEFSARPEGSIEDRKESFKKGKSLLGKYLTVKFFEYTEDKVPRHPVGIAVRDHE